MSFSVFHFRTKYSNEYRVERKLKNLLSEDFVINYPSDQDQFDYPF
jgi:hypothetical protein